MKKKLNHTTIVPISPPVLQTTFYDCGRACLKLILNTIGKKVPLGEITKIAGTTKEGTHPKGIIKALATFNIPHEVYHPGSIKLLQEKIRERKLCIVNYQAWARNGQEIKNLEAGHYSVVFGLTKTHLLIADPSSGTRSIRYDLFDKRWQDKEADGTITKKWMVAISPSSSAHSH